MPSDWYSQVIGGDLEQGDIIGSLPIFRVEISPDEGEDAEVIQEDHDIVILTQTCDLVNDKVQDVLVATVRPYEDLALETAGRNPNILSREFRKAAIDGNLPSYFLLPERADDPPIPWSLVDFHHVFSVPKVLVVQRVTDMGDRLRLIPPYKEHLGQAFARYIMRVGLPTPLHEFSTYDTAGIKQRLKGDA